MKINCSNEELITHFTVTKEEKNILQNRIDYNQLGLIVLIKYFIFEGKFPEYKKDIPLKIITFMAKQLKMNPLLFRNYDFNTKTIKSHRIVIREFLGFKEASINDLDYFTKWVFKNMDCSDKEKVKDYFFCYLKKKKTEPFSSKSMDRYSASITKKYEKCIIDEKCLSISKQVKKNINLFINLKDEGEKEPYDEMVKYVTALKLGSADTESILKVFTRNNGTHPTYKAFSELGKAIKTIFLCNYLNDESMRIEVNEGLNVIENWNSANSFIFF